jgi:prepilin-type N-terminal cleavage/methylation domain-containing protein
MGPRLHQSPGLHAARRAFTLIEIVVALTIIAVIAAVAIPTMKGLQREEQAAAPMRALAELVQDVRSRSMAERRAYQIVFEREAIHACESTFPQARREEFLKHLKDLRTPSKIDDITRESVVRTEVAREEFEAPLRGPAKPVRPPAVDADAGRTEAPKFKMPWTQTIPLPEKSECSVLLWGDGEWDLLEGEKIRRWVFQPSGMASPARVRLRAGTTEWETRFDALTGGVRAESSRLRTTDP